MNSPASSPARPVSRRRLRVFRVAAVLLAVLPFVLAELVLRLGGIGGADVSGGFDGTFPLFERRGQTYHTSPAREPFFLPQEFAARKPAGGFRAFCLGGSTVHGHPFEAATAFPKWLELELAATAPDRRIEVINGGGVSYASFRLVPVVREVLRYQPDVLIVATGHNEFLEDRTYQAVKARPAWRRWVARQLHSLRLVGVTRRMLDRSRQTNGGAARAGMLSADIKTRLDEATGYGSYRRDPEWHARVEAQFEDSLRQMTELCADAGVKLLLVRLGSNLRDCPPFKSEHRADLGDAAESAWQSAFDAGSTLEATDVKAALNAYRRAAAIDSEVAALTFRVARCLDRLGRHAEAREAYLNAREQDICPLRLLGRNERVLMRVAGVGGVPVVDVASLIEKRAMDGIPGNDWYLDHVHPSIGGHQLIAAALAARIRDLRWWEAANEWPALERRQQFARHLEQLGAAYFANGKRRVDWLEQWAQRDRLREDTVPRDGPAFLREGMRQLELADETAARQMFTEALNRDSRSRDALRAHATILEEQGRPALAALVRSWLAGELANPVAGGPPR